MSCETWFICLCVMINVDVNNFLRLRTLQSNNELHESIIWTGTPTHLQAFIETPWGKCTTWHACMHGSLRSVVHSSTSLWDDPRLEFMYHNSIQ